MRGRAALFIFRWAQLRVVAKRKTVVVVLVVVIVIVARPPWRLCARGK